MDKFTKKNIDLWNDLAKFHFYESTDHAFYDIEKFQSGNTSLAAIEQEEVGDVKGKSLLHLQCHFGLDTMSWARKGAYVTGVDFSDEAINIATELSSKLNIPAQFVCSDIYKLEKVLDKKF